MGGGDEAGRGRLIVARTLWAATAAERGPGSSGDAVPDDAALDEAAAYLVARTGRRSPPHPAAPAIGAVSAGDFRVTDDDTAAAMGHPDAGVQVLGTPRLGLWFELATSPLMPEPGAGVRHVGVGLVVHHLGRADVGEDVTVEARVLDVSGRAVVFTLSATAGGRPVGRGVHHRRILDADARAPADAHAPGDGGR
jgi:fluoroacetyl-CoA thioesterase